MRKLLVKLFALSWCIALCFSLVACSEFSGNFSVKATSEEIDATFEKLVDADIAIEGISGLQLEQNIDVTSKTQMLKTTAKIKSNYEKKEASCELTSIATEINTDGEDQQNSRSSFTGYWIKDGYFYNETQITSPNDTYSIQQKCEINALTSQVVPDVYSLVDSALDNYDFTEIFEMSAQELKEIGAEVYIDNSSNGDTKIKIVFNSSETKENYQLDGNMIFVFNSNNDIIAMKCNVDAKIGKDSDQRLYSVNLTLRNFAGSIKLPENSENWKTLDF